MHCHYSSPSVLFSNAHWENGRAEQYAAMPLVNQSQNHTKKQLQALFEMQCWEARRNGRDKAVNGNQKLEVD